MRDGDGKERDLAFARVIGQRGVHERLGDFGEGQGRRHRKGQCARTRHGAHVGEAHSHRDGTPGSTFGPESTGHAVGKVTEHRSDHFWRRVTAAERRLRADRRCATRGLNASFVVVDGERADLRAQSVAEQRA